MYCCRLHVATIRSGDVTAEQLNGVEVVLLTAVDPQSSMC